MFNYRDTAQHDEEERLATARSSLLPAIPPHIGATSHTPSFAAHPGDPPIQTFTIPRKALNTTATVTPESKRPDTSESEDGEILGGCRSAHQSCLAIIHTWWFEICACIVILGSFFAIVAVLYPRQNKPLPNWPWRISINALISILVITLKGAILLVVAEGLSQLKWAWIAQPQQLTDLSDFDKASRGPFGSLMFLLTLRGRNLIACLGAFLTVAALAIDPFAQQVARYYSCSVNGSIGSATIPRTNVFQGTSYHYQAGTGLIPGSLQAAITVGLFDPAALTIPFDCPTGNCTFPEPFHTMGYCSSCTDVTQTLSVDLTNYTGVYHSYGTYSNGSTEVYSFPVSLELFNTTLPTNLPSGLSVLSATPGSVAPLDLSFFTIGMDASETVVYFVLAASGDLFYNMNLTFGSVPIGPTWNATEAVGAASCSLYPCIRTYTADIYDGKISEKYHGSTLLNFEDTLDDGSAPYFASVNIPCLSPKQRQTLLQAGYILPPGADWISYNSSSASTSATYGVLGVDGQNCVYRFYQQNYDDIGAFLNTFLGGSVTQAGSGFNGTSVPLQIYNQSSVTFNDVQQTMESIADSITGYIRQNGETNFSEPALGIAKQQETCVRVNWWWLVYPVVMVVLTLVFFLATVASTRNAADWKSSILPLMRYQVWGNGGCTDNEGQILKVAAMEESARKIRVHINGAGKEWKFEKMD